MEKATQKHLLSCVSEECAEVAQVASKAIRFGLFDEYAGQTNREKLIQEFTDLVAVMEMALETNIITEINMRSVDEKKEKVKKFLKYSRERGEL